VANVLIAEDDLILADMVEMVLVTAGYSVCGIARTVAAAVALAEVHKPEFAVIDLRLANGGLGTAIAADTDALADTGILYATGNASAVMLAGAAGHACLAKPYSFPDLIRSLALVAEMKETGTAKPPFPRGFRILPAALVNNVAEPANGSS
jgi:ActR/RegA family two-component response regulator